MKPGYTADIGLEVHAELQTQSKMFCSCPVVDPTLALPNTAVCPICAGMPGALPMVNEQAIVFGLRVALALACTIAPVSRFARKNYFYPDLPKGYQISQFESPLAVNGHLTIPTNEGWLPIRIRRVHLEEDTGKLTHVSADRPSYTLVDLNRAGIPLLEIVSEPDMHTIAQVEAYSRALRLILQYLGVNSGDMEKGVIRFEANVSVRPDRLQELGTRVEIKNLNSFQSMTAAISYELDRQTQLLASGKSVIQETLGWDETQRTTIAQRSKEEAHDYRYFPEPDLPPLHISPELIATERAALPELPQKRLQRFMLTYELEQNQATLLTAGRSLADFYEATLTSLDEPDPRLVANWVLSELFGLMNSTGQSITELGITPHAFAAVITQLQQGKITATTARALLSKIASSGETVDSLIETGELHQISDRHALQVVVDQILGDHPTEVQAYCAGKKSLFQWFFGQAMHRTHGRANPAILQGILQEKLDG